METVENIEGYFKARCSYLVCKHSAVHPAMLSKSAYETLTSKFEAELQSEILQSLNTYEDNKGVDLIQLLNKLLRIGDQARKLFNEINGARNIPVLNPGEGLVSQYN